MTAIAFERGLPAALLPDPGWGSFGVIADDVLDLHEAALREADPVAELARLRTRGFRRGAARMWRDDAGRVVDLTLFEFSEASAARFSVDDGREAVRANGVSTWAVTGGFAATVGDGEFRASVVAVCWDRWQIAAVVEAGAGVRRQAAALAGAQIDALRRGVLLSSSGAGPSAL